MVVIFYKTIAYQGRSADTHTHTKTISIKFLMLRQITPAEIGNLSHDGIAYDENKRRRRKKKKSKYIIKI